MIYTRFGSVVNLTRLAVLEDVKKLDLRKPDKFDRDSIDMGAYYVGTIEGLPDERLFSHAFLKADGGSLEISKFVENFK